MKENLLLIPELGSENPLSHQIRPIMETKKIRYTVGFLFDDNMLSVALIEKSHPSWQKGKFNGIGGKINKYESPISGMIREFYEETGVLTSDAGWINCATVRLCNIEIEVFAAKNSSYLSELHSITEEKISVVTLAQLVSGNIPIILDVEILIRLCIQRLLW